MKSEDFILMPVPASAYFAVCALLGGASAGAVASGGSGQRIERPAEPQPVREPGTGQADQTNQADQGGGSAGQSGDAVEIDAHGHPWSADLHAATKGKTKDGLWRMKVGVSRPAPLPGFPVAASTGTAGNGGAAGATGSATTGAASGQASETVEEDDEFAAFRAAAAASDATDAAAKASVPARNWTDADLGALCNQAAVKLGDPTPVKEIIATFIPEGQVAHSRNIPAERREEFAKAVEAKAGIEFAG